MIAQIKAIRPTTNDRGRIRNDQKQKIQSFIICLILIASNVLMPDANSMNHNAGVTDLIDNCLLRPGLTEETDYLYILDSSCRVSALIKDEPKPTHAPLTKPKFISTKLNLKNICIKFSCAKSISLEEKLDFRQKEDLDGLWMFDLGNIAGISKFTPISETG